MAKKIRGFSKVTDEFNVNLREYVGLRHVGLTRSLQHRRYAPQGGTETAVLLDLRAFDRRGEVSGANSSNGAKEREMAQTHRGRRGRRWGDGFFSSPQNASD